jgi:hypothetical protein
VHALPLHVREGWPIWLLIELDDVFCLRVEIRRKVPDASGEHRIRGQAVGLVARGHASFAPGADSIVVQHGDGIGCSYRVFGMFATRSVDSQARNRSSKPDNSHEGLPPTDLTGSDLTRSGRRAHADPFGPAPASGFLGVLVVLEPGTLSSSFTVENLREAT